MAYRIYDLKCEDQFTPVVIDSNEPAFCWKVGASDLNTCQSAYRIRVWNGEKEKWDSGWVASDATAFVRYAGETLESGCRYCWRVYSISNHGEQAEATANFETALLKAADWHADWIEPEQEPAFDEPPRNIRDRERIPLEQVKLRPVQLIRKEFLLTEEALSARAYITAHGLYCLHINGKRVGDEQLTPGSTAYGRYLEYQTYDITELLHKGENALAVWLADGWYVGKHGMIGRSCAFGDTTGVLFQLEIQSRDGRRETVISDESCRCAPSEIEYADIFVGQKTDGRKIQYGVDRPYFNDSAWRRVHRINCSKDNLRAAYAEPVRIVQQRSPLKLYQSIKQEWILDVGQVLAGRVRMRVRGTRGTEITLEHSETVDVNGCFFNNIRGFFCHQTDTYVLRGEGEEVFEPEFTYHGFQYVRISGYPGTPRIEDFDVLVLASDLKTTLEFSCSDARINQLQHNIYWSQLSNMISVPTDCPQREKSGWTGDAQIFAPTACFNMDMLGFYRRWLRSMRCDQQPDGQIPVVIPYIEAYHPNGFFFYDTHTSAAWGDAAVLLPWTLYRSYGDEMILRENYEMMQKWIGYVQHTAESELPEKYEGEMTEERKQWQKYLWNTHMHFGDWLAPSVSVDPITHDINLSQSAFATMDIVPTCFYAYTTSIMAQIADILKKPEDASYYRKLNARIREAFAREYLDAEGLIKKRLQGVYVLALQMGLLDESVKQRNAEMLVQMIRENGNRLDTGFVSVKYLLDVLVENHEMPTAEAILMQEECPSWLYQVKNGATSMWEAWQAVLPDGTKTSVSYNHYALGCIGQWLYRRIGGMDAALPGFKRICFDPIPVGGIQGAHMALDTVHGIAEIDWRIEDGHKIIDLCIPANASGYLRTHGQSAIVDESVHSFGADIELCSGRHHIVLDCCEVEKSAI